MRRLAKIGRPIAVAIVLMTFHGPVLAIDGSNSLDERDYRFRGDTWNVSCHYYDGVSDDL